MRFLIRIRQCTVDDADIWLAAMPKLPGIVFLDLSISSYNAISLPEPLVMLNDTLIAKLVYEDGKHAITIFVNDTRRLKVVSLNPLIISEMIKDNSTITIKVCPITLIVSEMIKDVASTTVLVYHTTLIISEIIKEVVLITVLICHTTLIVSEIIRGVTPTTILVCLITIIISEMIMDDSTTINPLCLIILLLIYSITKPGIIR